MTRPGKPVGALIASSSDRGYLVRRSERDPPSRRSREQPRSICYLISREGDESEWRAPSALSFGSRPGGESHGRAIGAVVDGCPPRLRSPRRIFSRSSIAVARARARSPRRATRPNGAHPLRRLRGAHPRDADSPDRREQGREAGRLRVVRSSTGPHTPITPTTRSTESAIGGGAGAPARGRPWGASRRGQSRRRSCRSALGVEISAGSRQSRK